MSKHGTEQDPRIPALAHYLTRKVGEPKLPIGTRVAVRSFEWALGTVVGPDGYPKGSSLAVRMDPPHPEHFDDGYACVSVGECRVIPSDGGAPRKWWRRKPRHRHQWAYRPRTVSGWGVVRCATCGAEDIYS